MKVLLVGSGGREHAIAWKLCQSAHLTHLWIAPGNAGTAQLGTNIPISVEDGAGLVNFSIQNNVDLVIIGPEVALAAGISDALRKNGVLVFGPSQSAARIESSKVFAKRFMARHAIPTAKFDVFSQLKSALEHIDRVDYPFVIKASGLAAGKGVVLPENKEDARRVLKQILVERRFGNAGDEVVIEERLEGEEVSLMAFTDGISVSSMPPAQDHKRLLDGDRGPNTGGMGAYAPAPILNPSMQKELEETVLQAAVNGLRTEGIPFQGVLYAGLILTQDGPRVLEYNARFGDPETQVVLPLLESDLLEICLACTRQELGSLAIRWAPKACVCVVMASAGYPERSSPPVEIHGLDILPTGCIAFHAGTSTRSNQIFTAGGRVLGVTATAARLHEAVDHVYQAVGGIQFDGLQFRKDIARRALKPSFDMASSSYSQAGVNIDTGNRAVTLMGNAVRATYNEKVLGGIGAFGGLFDARQIKEMHSPVLVSSTDGVGTKVKLAASLGRFRGIGIDIVNHCTNDILVQGARPLFFLDYFATSTLNADVVAEIVTGISEACQEIQCVLIGGETAEMPGVYAPGEFDLAGTIVGCVERDQILPRSTLKSGDVLIGLGSNGPHTNGYSLLRKIFENEDLVSIRPELGVSLADALLMPHRSYLSTLSPLLELSNSPIKALVHITGGGFLENIPRVLPEGLGVRIRRGSWPVPALFKMVQLKGEVNELEMYRIFNMGIGMAAVVERSDAEALQTGLAEDSWVIGEVVHDPQQKVCLE